MKNDLIAALERLASSAEEQTNYLIRLGTAPLADELALEFSDALGVQHDTLAPEALAVARSLDTLLHQMSGERNANLWTLEALRVSPEWAHVRELAQQALLAIPPE